MLAQNVEVIDSFCTDLEKAKIKAIKTVQMTKYPESKEMRGIMKASLISISVIGLLICPI